MNAIRFAKMGSRPNTQDKTQSDEYPPIRGGAVIYTDVKIIESTPYLKWHTYICYDGINPLRISHSDPRTPEPGYSPITDPIQLDQWAYVKAEKAIQIELAIRFLAICNQVALDNTSSLLSKYPELNITEQRQWNKHRNQCHDFQILIVDSNLTGLPFFNRLCLRTSLEYLKYELIDWLNEHSIQQLKAWKGTKSEFAKMVNDTYDQNPAAYKSRYDAADKLFHQYKFEDESWTVDKCYDLMKKV
jgi:hypothetical protein